MSRRVSNTNTPDSLKNVKALEEQAKARTTSAENRLAEVTNEITTAEYKKDSLSDEIALLESEKESKLAELDAVKQQVSGAKDELRKVEGELITARDEVAAENAAIAKAKADHETLLENLKREHKEKMSAYESTQAEAKKTIEDMADTVKAKKRELEGAQAVLARFKKEEVRLEREVLPRIPEAEKKLETLNHQVLVKQKELQEAETAHAEMVGKYNDEKVEYEKVHALRVGEEQRVEEELKKLATKQDEVESKARSLRIIQEGVDQATARLNRKEEELQVKEHLFKQREVTRT